MATLPLIGGAYLARSVIAERQRCINLYPEENPQGAPVPVTHYATPGLIPKLTAANGLIIGPGRGAYTATNGELFIVVGTAVYFVDAGWVQHLLGTIPFKATPVTMQDNGQVLLLADGTHGNANSGWTIDLISHAFAAFADPNWIGADRLAYLDTFILMNEPDTKNFYSTLSNDTAIDSTYIAAKTAYPDILQSLAVVHREILLLGSVTAEVWTNVGSPGFPFQIIPGASQQHGTAAKYSVAQNDMSIFFVHRDLNGWAMVLRYASYKMLRISDHSIENILNSAPTVRDCVGFCYQIAGHSFYVLTIPGADQTWVFDDATQMWHQWAWWNGQEAPHRARSICHAFAYEKHVTLDWENGRLYWLDFNTYTDFDGSRIQRVRGFSHIITGYNSEGQALSGSGKLIHHRMFMANMDVGEDPGTDTAHPPKVSLRWSDDKGKSWGNALERSLGSEGQYLTNPIWWQLGMARDRIYELSWNAPIKALNGAYIDPMAVGK